MFLSNATQKKVLAEGGDPLDNARVVFERDGFSDEDDAKIKNEALLSTGSRHSQCVACS